PALGGGRAAVALQHLADGRARPPVVHGGGRQPGGALGGGRRDRGGPLGGGGAVAVAGGHARRPAGVVGRAVHPGRGHQGRVRPAAVPEFRGPPAARGGRSLVSAALELASRPVVHSLREWTRLAERVGYVIRQLGRGGPLVVG